MVSAVPSSRRKDADINRKVIRSTIEEELRNCRLAMQLVSELLEAVAVAAPVRGGEGLSAEGALAAARLCREAAGGLRSLSRVLPAAVLNHSITR